jgi:hypothetical protein
MEKITNEPLFNVPAKIFIFTSYLVLLLALHGMGVLFLGIFSFPIPLIIFCSRYGVFVNDKKELYNFYSLFSFEIKQKVNISDLPYIQIINKNEVFQPFTSFKGYALQYKNLSYDIWLIDKLGRKKLHLYNTGDLKIAKEKLDLFCQYLELEYFKPKSRGRTNRN